MATTRLTPFQQRIMVDIGRGWEAIPGDRSVLTINGERACTVRTMRALERAGLVRADKYGSWARTEQGREWFEAQPA